MLNTSAFKLVTSFSEQGLIASEMVHIFDLDDTLLRTRQLVISAYESAGVPRQTVEDNWGRSAEEWCEPEIRQIKRDMYHRILYSGHTPQVTALYDCARSGLMGTNVVVLTGASLDSYHLLQQVVGFLPPLLGCAMRKGQKEATLRQIMERMTCEHVKRGFVFYEDSETEINSVLQSRHTWPDEVKKQAPLYIGKYEGPNIGNNGREGVTIFNSEGAQAWTQLF